MTKVDVLLKRIIFVKFLKSLSLFFLLQSCTFSSKLSVNLAPNQTLKDKVVEATEGVVAASHPLASEAGVLILKQGGNAIDAALAASFAISVLRPQSTGIGGGGFALVYKKESGKVIAYDFRERAPLQASEKMYQNKDGSLKEFFYKKKKVGLAAHSGHQSVGVPGMIAGLLEMHKKHGTLPLSKIMEPAIQLAENGFPIYRRLVNAIKDEEHVLRSFPQTRKIFFPNDKVPKEGDLFVQKELAHTLSLIASQGEYVFYHGKIAHDIVSEMKQGGGVISLKDFENYKVKISEPITTDYRQYRVVGMPLPSSGGIHIIQILNMLSEDDIYALKHNSVEYLHLLVECMRRAYADRAEYLGDPDFYKVPIKGLLSKNYALSLRKSIDPKHATPSIKLKAGQPFNYESPSTSHISTVDKWGNSVSTTHTINDIFGSGVTVDGMILNNEMDDFSSKPGTPNSYGLVGSQANAIAPGKTMLSSMSPTMVFDEKGELKWVLGAPGGPRIITATLQTLINVIDFKMPLSEAVQADRVHHQWLPDEVYYEENGLSPKVIKGLSEEAYQLKTSNFTFGDIQALERLKNGNWVGVSDKRSDGEPRGVHETH